VIANTNARRFDVIEVTNEMPLNRIGGVGTVIEHLMSGFQAIGVRALWFLTQHEYPPAEIEQILRRFPSVAVGSHEDLARLRAPAIHLHAYAMSDGLVETLASRPFLYSVHSLLVEEERSNDVDLSSGVRWQEELIGLSSEVTLTSEAERRRYRRLGYSRLNPRVSVVHNGIRPVAARRPTRGMRSLGYCGRLVPRKHPEYVQMVLREPGFERSRALIAGKAFSPYARDLLQRLRLERRVRFLGWCGSARLEAFYDAIDVLAVPSIYEPFGLAALEAAARGVPVVCTRVDGLVEIFGDHAFYSDGFDYPSFHQAMVRWRSASSEEIAAVTAGARRRHLERFTDVAMAEAYRARLRALSA
jgi:glycosyltransferase involved in cell wall biosynthesis